jgi:hypothetical protein
LLPLLVQAATPTGTLTVTPNNGPAPLAVTVAWNIAGAATCSASGDWSGTKATSGSEVVGGLAAGTRTFNLNCNDGQAITGTASLSWTPPTKNTDGSNLTNLASYKVYRSASAATIESGTVIVVPAPATGTVIASLANGTWYFGVKSTASDGDDSAMSSPLVSKTITQGGGASATFTATANVSAVGPQPPTLVTVTISAVFIKQGAAGPWIAGNAGSVAVGIACFEPMLLDRTGNTPDYYGVSPDDVQNLKPIPAGATVGAQCSS